MCLNVDWLWDCSQAIQNHCTDLAMTLEKAGRPPAAA
jgi:hypothetical protein